MRNRRGHLFSSSARARPMILVTILSLWTSTSLVACGPAPAPRQALMPTGSSAYGPESGPVRLWRLWSGQRPVQQTMPGEVAYWSPSGNLFALTLDASQGLAVWGTLRPLHLWKVHLGMGLRVVGLTDRYLIATSADQKQTYLYPFEASDRLGSPTLWTGPSDPWEEWIALAQGLSIETGGYTPGTLALGVEYGQEVALHGGEMYLSADRRFGAVLARTREPWAILQSGAVEIQPGDNRSSIAIWQLDAEGGPRRLATLHLPLQATPPGKEADLIQVIEFSRDDRYVAVQLWNPNDLASESSGITFIYTVRGRLVGKAPYGSGFEWLPTADDIWLNTPYPPGRGMDRVVDTQGQTLTTWSDALGQTIFPISQDLSLAYQSRLLGPAYRSNVLGLIEHTHFRPLPRVPLVYTVRFSSVSPGGRAAIVETDGLEQYIWLILLR